MKDATRGGIKISGGRRGANGGGGGEGGGEDGRGRGRGNEDVGIVQINLPLGTCECASYPWVFS